MRSSLPSATKQQINRWQQAQNVGCVCCCLAGRLGVPGDIHHILSGGRRISHDHTLCLCPWHHRGIEGSLETHGPSLALHPRLFKETYGTEKELLEIQNELIQHYIKVTSTNGYE
jgi:hypothetical protein